MSARVPFGPCGSRVPGIVALVLVVVSGSAFGQRSTGRLGPVEGPPVHTSALETMAAMDATEFNRLYAGKVLTVSGPIQFRSATKDGQVTVRFRSAAGDVMKTRDDLQRQVVARLNKAAWNAEDLEKVEPPRGITLTCRCGGSGTIIFLEACEPPER